MNFGVCDFSRFAVTDWRLRRWRFRFLALVTATRRVQQELPTDAYLYKKKAEYIRVLALHGKQD